MKYFIDTEFLEGPQRERLFGIPTVGLRWDKDDCLEIYKRYTPPTIDLISIGIVAEDGREYYAISKDFNLKEAWNRFDLEIQSGDMRNLFPNGKKIYWLRENVLKPIFYELIGKDIEFHDFDSHFTYKSFKFLIDKYGKTNNEIAREIREFGSFWNTVDGLGSSKNNPPEFYAYFADYDWVVFCWLFGKMIDLPQGFPMYCKDLKQMIDEKPLEYKVITSFANGNYVGGTDPYYSEWKDHVDFPKQDPSKSHNAIEDARWNKKLYEFLNTL